jgi:SHS2 domain-containing protein
MFSMITELESVVPTIRREVHLEAPDRETLLVDWLNELLYLWEVEGEVYSRFDIASLSSTELSAEVEGGEAEKVTKFIKAATFHDLEIAETDEGYVATITFDV